MKRPGLGLKLLFINTAVILSLGAATLVIVKTIAGGALTSESHKTWILIAEHMAEELVDSILARDELNLRALLVEHKESFANARYIFFANERGEIVAHTFESGFPTGLKRLVRLSPSETRVKQVVLDGFRIADIAAPALDGGVGELHIGFSTASIAAATQRLQWTIIAAIAVAVLLQWALTVSLSVLIIKPIKSLKDLAEQVRRIGQGETGSRVEVKSRDEVGELAEAYNRMRDDLRVSRERLRALASRLSLAEEKERRRIAVELHDEVGQTLAISKIRLDALREQLAGAPPAGDIEEVKELIERVIQATRTLILDISPPVLYEMGLSAALEWLCERIQEDSGVAVTLEEKGTEEPLDEQSRVLVFQVVRELLLNVAKHSGAARATVSVLWDHDEIEASVSDDGAGFDVAGTKSHSTRHDGFGLFSIKERLECAGGRFDIVSNSESGTMATIAIPRRPGS